MSHDNHHHDGGPRRVGQVKEVTSLTNPIIKDIKECQAKNAPVLVGTATIETSEYLSQLLTRENIAVGAGAAFLHVK